MRMRHLVTPFMAVAILAGATAGAVFAQPASPVVVDEVTDGVMTQTLPVSGRLISRQVGDVAARVGGPVEAVEVDVGSRVEIGDVLAVLDTSRLAMAVDLATAAQSEQDAAVEAAQALLSQAERELARLANLRTSAAFNQANYDSQVSATAAARSDVRRAEAMVLRAAAELEMATENLTDATITAPFPGVVAELYITDGDFLNLGHPVVRLVNDRDLEVEADVPTARLQGLSVGTEVRIVLDDRTEHTAILRAIVPEENPLTRTRLVRFTPTFGETQKALASNQSVTVNLPVGDNVSVVTVHKDAVIASPQGTIVYVMADGTAQIRPVQLGEADGDRFQVLSGLAAGDLAIIRGNERLQPGQPVMVGDQS